MDIPHIGERVGSLLRFYFRHRDGRVRLYYSGTNGMRMCLDNPQDWTPVDPQPEVHEPVRII